jgi:protein-disulfide isomerase
VVVGVAALAYALSRPKAGARNVADGPDTTNAGPAQGYLLGSPDAPVRKRIVDPGLASLTFYDFPLTMHPNTMPAHNAAACADEQGKFWPMHDRIFQSQDEWNGQATDSPKAFFERYAREVGLDMGRWEACYDAKKYEGRINANLADGLRRGVNSTPSFVIGNKLYPGSMSYDELKAIVDSAVRTARAASPASGTPATR